MRAAAIELRLLGMPIFRPAVFVQWVMGMEIIMLNPLASILFIHPTEST